MTKQDNVQKAKQAAGKAAAEFIQNGMLVGIGTGSTASFFIERLVERCQNDHLKIKIFPTSERSAKQAMNGGIPLCDDTITTLDLTVDGADEIDHQKRMIKGGGGALLREKILASISSEMIVIVDQHKLVNKLGHFPLPLEVVPFAYHATLYKIRSFGYDATMRLTKEKENYLTDNGNYIIDVTFPTGCLYPEKDQAILSAIPGIIETGFFFGLAGRVIVGQLDGTVKIW